MWLITPEHLHFTTLSSLGHAALTKDSRNAAKACLYLSLSVLIDNDNFSSGSIRLLTEQIGLCRLQHQTYVPFVVLMLGQCFESVQVLK